MRCIFGSEPYVFYEFRDGAAREVPVPESEMPKGEDDRKAALGRHLRALRKQRGWTQDTLSKKSGISGWTGLRRK